MTLYRSEILYQKTVKSILAIVLVMCVICLVPIWSEVTEWIQRRQSGDIYKTNGSEAHQTCETVTPTYLVDRNECVKDQQLLNGDWLSNIDCHNLLNITLQDATILRLLFQWNHHSSLPWHISIQMHQSLSIHFMITIQLQGSISVKLTRC